ncbi:unnamed protein product, partial [Sphenostylis stenocarpa]
ELMAAILLGRGFSYFGGITCRTVNIRNVLNLEKKTAKLAFIQANESKGGSR